MIVFMFNYKGAERKIIIVLLNAFIVNATFPDIVE